MLTKSARIADTAPNAATGVDMVSKDAPPAAAPRNRGDYRAMGQGDLHPNELYA